jgi:hypothetical protein
MTPEAALARLRRREKKILYDQIRERRRNNIETQATDTPARRKKQVQYSADRFPMKIQVKDKWQEVPVYDGAPYSWIRRHLKRRFRLKSWRWDLHVKENEREGWVKVSPNPFQILKEARYRVVLTEQLRKPRPGKQTSKLTEEQRRRPNSKANRGKDPFKWTAPAPEPAPTPPPVQPSVVKPTAQTPIVITQPKAKAPVQKSTPAPPPPAPRKTEKQSFTWSPTPNPTPTPSPPPRRVQAQPAYPMKAWVKVELFTKGVLTWTTGVQVMTTDTQEQIRRKVEADRRGKVTWREGSTFSPPIAGNWDTDDIINPSWKSYHGPTYQFNDD